MLGVILGLLVLGNLLLISFWAWLYKAFNFDTSWHNVTYMIDKIWGYTRFLPEVYHECEVCHQHYSRSDLNEVEVGTDQSCGNKKSLLVCDKCKGDTKGGKKC